MIKRKAQINTTDILVGVIIFITLVAFIMISWYSYNEKLLTRLERESVISKAVEITDNFVKMPGIPSYWNRSNVEFIGLAYSDRKISEKKVQEFCNISYNETRNSLNLIYHFHFSIEEAECGIEPSEEARKVVSITRPVIYKNETALLKLSLWR